MKTRLAHWWGLLRRLSTDDAYERYLAHHEREHPGGIALSRRAFYLREQEHKWAGVKRCC
jgi:uncharacterized short protein YbdD (DUF466 family)